MLTPDQIQIALATPLPDDSVSTPHSTPTVGTSRPTLPARHTLVSTPLTARQPIIISEFWTKEPLLWFAQTEAKFRRANVTDSHVKYDHVLTHLNNDTLATILDLIEDVDDSTVDPYTILKERLLTTFSVTPRQRAHQLLHLPPLGDQRPSALMDKMLALLPSTEKPGLLFHEIFLEKMPQNIREHLATQQFTSPRQMARHADQLWDTRPQEAAAAAIAALSLSNPRAPSPQRGRSPTQQRGFKRSGSPAPRQLCHYHRRFGVEARNCQPPCSWRQPDPAHPPQLCYYHNRFGASAQKCEQPCSWMPRRQENYMAAGGQ